MVINPEFEVSFTISDAAGRTVMSGKLDNYTGTANNLLTWSCQAHDTVTAVAGFGNCLESRSIDALGNATKSLTDGAGRTLRSIDQLGNATVFTYDAGGNRLSVRDPNSVGQDVVYNALGRTGLTTDTANHATNNTYDKAGNRIATIDGKNQTTSYSFDARGRQKSQIDRISGVTSFTYLATGQLASLTDAESQTTSYTYDDAGGKLTEQWKGRFAPNGATHILLTQSGKFGRIWEITEKQGVIMGRPNRSEQFSPDEVCIVHTIQRCVRRAFLAGVDQQSGKVFSYRREWIRRGLESLASVFGIDLLTYVVISNHS